MLKSFHKKAFLKTSPTLTTKNIINITQNTSEEIEEQYVKDFLNNCIKSENQKITINSKLFYTYFEKNNLYEIFFIENLNNKDIPLPFIFSEIHNNEYDEVFLYDRYFIVYSKGEFKLFKEINTEISSNDILNFILHRYEINVDKVHKFSNHEIDEIKNKYISNKQKSIPYMIDLKKDKRVFSLFSFTLFLLLIPLIHYNFFHKEENSNQKIDKKLQTLEKRYQNLIEQKDRKKSQYIINTLLQIKNNNLKLQSINLNKNKIHLFIESKNKIKLLEFIDKYNGEIKIDKLNFNEKTKMFDLEVSIVI